MPRTQFAVGCNDPAPTLCQSILFAKELNLEHHQGGCRSSGPAAGDGPSGIREQRNARCVRHRCRARSLAGRRSGVGRLPGVHLFGTDGNSTHDASQLMRAAAEPLESELVRALADIARDAQVWLIPGSVCDYRDLLERFTTRRSCFRPTASSPAPTASSFPGAVVVHARQSTGDGRPSRHRPPRPVDLLRRVVPRGESAPGVDGSRRHREHCQDDDPRSDAGNRAGPGHAIVNQVFTVNVNTAGPARTAAPSSPTQRALFSKNRPTPALACSSTRSTWCASRRYGRCRRRRGTNRMWEQFQPNDAPVEMPLYSGELNHINGPRSPRLCTNANHQETTNQCRKQL